MKATQNEASIEVDTTHTSSEGVTTTLKSKAVVVPCPDVNGRFTATAVVDVSATAGGAGQTGTLNVTLDGQLDDNAALASSDIGYRMQWADFAGGKGQFVDLLGPLLERLVPGGQLQPHRWHGDGGVRSVDGCRWQPVRVVGRPLPRGGGAEGLESGSVRAARCFAGCREPKGLQPSSTSTITAAPRSKIDGGAVGGNVTATLTAGGASVDPASSPVPADATMTCTSPDQPSQSGTVSLEAPIQARRGEGRDHLRHRGVGLPDHRWPRGLAGQSSRVRCDAAVRTVDDDIGTMQLSGGLSGTYEFSGVFSSHYTGTYQITLPPDPASRVR